MNYFGRADHCTCCSHKTSTHAVEQKLYSTMKLLLSILSHREGFCQLRPGAYGILALIVACLSDSHCSGKPSPNTGISNDHHISRIIFFNLWAFALALATSTWSLR